MAVTVPNATLPFAFITKAYGTAHIRANVAQSDIDYLDSLANGAFPQPGDQDNLRSSAMLQVTDKDKLVDRIDDITDTVDRYRDVIDNINANLISDPFAAINAVPQLRAAAGDMADQLRGLKGNTYFAGLNALLVSSSALAAGTWYDARNDAMGGTGVASSHWSSAVLANPALMTRAQPEENAGIIFPSAGKKAQCDAIVSNSANSSAYPFQFTAMKR
ncbi:hypothetical protein CRX72_06570 [Pantoea sp. BRM17]|nr:hypothetical protein CRX72_06570 [Pantoea sp. BRM17]